MRIIVREGISERIFSVTNQTQATTLEHILVNANYDLRNWKEVWVDNYPYSLNTACADIPLLEGAVLSNQQTNHSSKGWQLSIVGGDSTGQIYPLPESGTVRLGRADEAEVSLSSPSISWSHALISTKDGHTWIRDDNSSNGTFIDSKRIDPEEKPVELKPGQIISLGGVCLRFEQAQELPSNQANSISLGATISFNRPPRPALPKTPKPIEVPIKKEPGDPPKFSWIGVIAPLLMAVALVAVMGSARYALIALLSPFMAIGSWLEQKRRSKGNKKEEEEKYVAALADFTGKAEIAIQTQRTRLIAQMPYPHDCMEHSRVGSSSLWQVRTKHEDYWCASLGTAKYHYKLPLEGNNHKFEERAQKILDQAELPASPVKVDFTLGPVGIWGDRDTCQAIARSLLCQLATRSGPADMTVGVFTGKDQSENWRWTAWLPHTQIGGANPNDRWIGYNEESSQSMLRSLRDRVDELPAPSLLLLIDQISLLEGRDSPARELLEYNINKTDREKTHLISGIVIASHPDRLPAACSTVIEAKPDSEATLTIPAKNDEIKHITSNGIKLETSLNWARSLARYDDPDTRAAGAALPSLVHLFDLLNLNRNTVNGEQIRGLWQKQHGFSVPLGLCEDGIFYFDLVKDGPHGLVGGTTGSGKSELLRSLVAGLAARVDPQHLTFILVDFKGGAAFASLDQLPHTIGTLSNLEPSLAYRAIKSLEAEMRYRQECFAKAGDGIDNLDAYLATNPEMPMPRLLVVVDEFAQLAKDYPDVLSSLVAIGAVGRTLGVHMILATQRPAGVVNDDILANTNMRTALRVQSKDDSTNVISVPHAASIGREQKGRAYIKLGEEDITPIQTALVTGISSQNGAEDLYVDEVILGFPPPEHATQYQGSNSIDMDVLIEAIQEAQQQSRFSPPRPVWPEPLKENIQLETPDIVGDSTDTPSDNQLDSVPNTHSYLTPTSVCPRHDSSEVMVALADDPRNQTQYQMGWDIAEGNLVIAGIAGSGTTTTLISLACSLASTYSPEEADFLYLDLINRGLEHLQHLPHSRGYAGPGSANQELQKRLLRYLHEELDRRTTTEGSYPKLFVFIDGMATLRDEYDDIEGMDMLQNFYQVWAKGPAAGIHCVANTTRLKALPSAIDEVTVQKWLYRLADPYDYSTAGVHKDNLPAQIPGRFVDSRTGHHGHIALVKDYENFTQYLRETRGYSNKPVLVKPLPSWVEPKEMVKLSRVQGESWLIPIGIAESDMSEFFLEAWEDEHIMIAGDPRSGKSSMLLAIAEKMLSDSKQQGINLTVLATCSRRSPVLSANFDMVVPHSEATSVISRAELANSPTLLLIDDAHALTDTDQSIAGLLQNPNPNLLIIAAGRSAELKGQYGQWTTQLRKSKLGVILQPYNDLDGDLLGAQIPRRSPVKLTTARGYASQNGTVSLVQAITVRDGE